jgi:hypothetical protein
VFLILYIYERIYTMRTKQQRTFTEAEKAAYRVAKQERLTDLGERLKQEVAAVQDSDTFKRYLAAQARFHRYSARNVFLSLYQYPDATRVAGYTTWQKLGRQVRRGATGITIFAPAPFKQKTTDITTGEVNEELIPRFKTATVFDYSQTVGEPLPTIKLGEIVGSAPDGAYAALADFAASIGTRSFLTRRATRLRGAAITSSRPSACETARPSACCMCSSTSWPTR